jgi:hypothetical protein
MSLFTVVIEREKEAYFTNKLTTNITAMGLVANVKFKSEILTFTSITLLGPENLTPAFMHILGLRQ